MKEIKPKDGKTIEFESRVNGCKLTAILDTGSPITIMPRSYRKWVKPFESDIPPVDRRFVDLNGNEVKIRKVLNLETSLNGVKKQIKWWEVKAKTKPIIEMDNFEVLGLRLLQNRKDEKLEDDFTENSSTKFEKKDNSKFRSEECVKQVGEDENSNLELMKGKIYSDFKKLFTENHEIKNFAYDVEVKKNIKVFQQKGRRVPIHLQSAVEAELNKLQKEGHLVELEELREDVCVSPAVIAQKSDGSIKIALDAKELNEKIVRKRMQMPCLKDLKDRVSMKASQNRNLPLWASTIDLNYAFGLVKLAEKTSKHCVIAIEGGKATGQYRFKRGFYGLADMPVVFQEM